MTYQPNWDNKPVKNKLIKLEIFAQEYFSYQDARQLHSIKDIQKKFGNQSPGHDLSIYFKELLLIRQGNYIPNEHSYKYMFSWSNLLWAFIKSGLVTEDEVSQVIEKSLIPTERTTYSVSLCLTVYQREAKCKEFFDYRFFTEYNMGMLEHNVPYNVDEFTGRHLADFQNTSKRIKSKFFAGYWDTDLDAASYTLIHQHYVNTVLPWWGSTGFEIKVVPLVYQQKNKVRKHFSQELNIPLDLVKQVLACIMFDCKLVNNRFNGVYKLLTRHGIDTQDFFERAKNSVLLTALIKELRHIWARCMSYWNNTNEKSGRQTFRSEWTDKETGEIKSRFKPSRFRAKIYFELEKKVMDIVRDEMRGKLCHLMHDGFISKEQPDVELLKKRIKSELSFEVSFTSKTY